MVSVAGFFSSLLELKRSLLIGGIMPSPATPGKMRSEHRYQIIAHAKIKTDTIDAGVLAQLYASGFLPEVRVPDEAIQALRRQVSRRQQIVKQRSRLKNIIQFYYVITLLRYYVLQVRRRALEP